MKTQSLRTLQAQYAPSPYLGQIDPALEGLRTFTVDGLIAGSWRAEEARGRLGVRWEPFEPLPVRVRREVDAEAERLAASYSS